eukprot:s1402_g11.t1
MGRCMQQPKTEVGIPVSHSSWLGFWVLCFLRQCCTMSPIVTWWLDAAESSGSKCLRRIRQSVIMLTKCD